MFREDGKPIHNSSTLYIIDYIVPEEKASEIITTTSSNKNN